MKDIVLLRKHLVETEDPTEYDTLIKQIAEIEKEESLKKAALARQQREAAEARIKALTKEREVLIAEGEKVKATLDEAKPALVEAFNAAFIAMEDIWAKVDQMKKVSDRVKLLNDQLGTTEVFSMGDTSWAGASLAGDPIEGFKALVQRFHDLWRHANHRMGERIPNPLTKIKPEQMHWGSTYRL